MNLKVSIENSNVTLGVDCSAEPRKILGLLYKHALDACRLPIGIVGFQHGIGLSVILEKIIYSDGEERALVFEDPSLFGLCTSYAEHNHLRVLELCFGRVVVIQVFNDLMASLIYPHVSLVNCARVIDTLKKDCCTGLGNEKAAWENFRNSLNLTEDYIKYITSNSKEPRHGGGGYISGDICSEVLKRTWFVFDRYLNMLVGDGKALDKSKYPLV